MRREPWFICLAMPLFEKAPRAQFIWSCYDLHLGETANNIRDYWHKTHAHMYCANTHFHSHMGCAYSHTVCLTETKHIKMHLLQRISKIYSAFTDAYWRSQEERNSWNWIFSVSSEFLSGSWLLRALGNVCRSIYGRYVSSHPWPVQQGNMNLGILTCLHVCMYMHVGTVCVCKFLYLASPDAAYWPLWTPTQTQLLIGGKGTVCLEKETRTHTHTQTNIHI